MGLSFKLPLFIFLAGGLGANLRWFLSIFASKTTYINPESFTLMESIIILLAVILGGIGSIRGVIIGALIIKLLPEYMQFIAQYRMLVFGIILVIMMIFRPEGFIKNKRQVFLFKGEGSA